jgi:DNA-binding NarL/FixJ family response regulator
VNNYTIVLADDHILFRQGVRKILEEVKGLQVVGEAKDGLDLLELLKKTRPDLVILDISMPNLRGLEAAREIKTLYPEIKILLLTMHKDRDLLQEGVEARVDGFLVKEDADSDLLQAVTAIRKGQKYFSLLISDKLVDLMHHPGKADPLTPREKEILKLVAEGRTSKEVAELLYISPNTVQRHRDKIMNKLDLKNLAELVLFALKQGYITNNP